MVKPDFLSSPYCAPRNYIRKQIEDGKSWQSLLDLPPSFFENAIALGYPPDIRENWVDFVEWFRRTDEKREELYENRLMSTLDHPGQLNEVGVEYSDDSCWMRYRSKLIDEGFTNIDVIESECHNILKHLSQNTIEYDPIKGLVIGYVQSGKTANMAGLIAMAADAGWNMFIILSGSIESLRIQTKDRLLHYLDNNGRINWQPLDQLSPSKVEFHPSRLDFSINSDNRYFTVCLKYPRRLTDLLDWLNLDQNKKKQMRIILIDDEADQAGVRITKPDQERNTVNNLIVNIVSAKDSENKTAGPYAAMNYVSYTATPYANFLSDDSEESLYPRNFVTMLSPPNIYFGPLELYGSSLVEGKDGLGVVRSDSSDNYGMIDISTNVDTVLSDFVQSSDSSKIPDVLRDAVCWFLCADAVLKLRKYTQPVSMLVHTSHITDKHDRIADVIRKYLSSPKEVVLDDCRKIYEKKTKQFPRDFFFKMYPGYGVDRSEVLDYPDFDDLSTIISDILSVKVQPIEIDKKKKLVFSKGIHLCIDNSKKDHSAFKDDEVHGNRIMPRLFYPSKEQLSSLPYAPPFIVVGGNTLSRGLTLKGLVSTVFARKVSQGDTLMQMGRWFGYRKGYELLPRVWMSDKSYDSFKILIDSDEDLRAFIRHNYKAMSPEDLPARVRVFPRTGYLLRMTSPNKSYAASISGVDYSGVIKELHSYSKDAEESVHNINTTERFLISLGTGADSKITSAVFWTNVTNEKIFGDFLKKLKISPRNSIFDSLDDLEHWIDKNCKANWNVVLAGVSNSSLGTWTLPNGLSVNKVYRTAKNNPHSVYIKSVSQPIDRFADLIVSDLEEKQQEDYNNLIRSPSGNWRVIRDDFGLKDVPLLIIYRISGEDLGSEVMDFDSDLIGLALVMPGLHLEGWAHGYQSIPPFKRGD